MSAPLLPSPLDYIGRRSFGFYPPIRNAGPNSWILGAGSWSEVQVINSNTGTELWIPRPYIGAVSDNHDSLTVGLNQSVELQGAVIVPRSKRRVIEMPPPREALPMPGRTVPASVVAIRLESTKLTTFRNTPFRLGVLFLFVVGLLALVASASR